MSVKSRTRSITKLAAVPVGLLVSGVLVLGYSNAAFTAQTTNASNTWSTGTVSLTNDLTKPMFDYQNAPANKGTKDALLVPGASVSNTIKVDYTGNTPANVKLYSTLGADAGSIAQYMDVKINDGTSDIYTGTMSQLAAKNSFATGIGTWAPTGTDSKSYTVTVTLKASAPQASAGQNIAGTTFTWDAQTP